MFNYYVAHIGITDCIADIRLNDVPIFMGEVDGYQSFSIPLNPCIDHNGIQMLTVMMLPPFDATDIKEKTLSNEGSIRVEVSLFDVVDGMLQGGGTVVSSYIEGGALLSALKIDNKPFEARIDYPVKRWSDCMRLDDGRDLKPAVLTFYNRIGKMLKNGQYGMYESMVLKREKEIVYSLGLDEKEIAKRQRMLEDAISNGFEFVDIQGDEQLLYFAGGRALSLRTVEKKPALRFYNKETGGFLGVDIMIGIKNGSSTFSII